MGIDKQLDYSFGILKKGSKNLITDVSGITVGHVTLCKGDIQTGVTAILPHQGNLFQDKPLCASHVINGYGKSVGLIQVDELGTLETPIILTNTLSVGTASTALIRYMLERNADIGDTTSTVNPVVFECNDGYLNDIRGMHITEEHVREALEHTGDTFAEGAVGAGRGMTCYGLKGGIGSSSRMVTLYQKEYTVGALLLTNFGTMRDLTICGDPVGNMLYQKKQSETVDKGSVIIVLATDAPLSSRQLQRMAKRAQSGLARTGTISGNGSGEIALAFTTQNRMPHYPTGNCISYEAIFEEDMNAFFRAAIECVEESVISSLVHAEAVTGRKEHHRDAFAEVWKSIQP